MKRLLIIDDEAGIVEEVEAFFKEEGFEVETADTTKDGLEAVENFHPHLVVLDIKLPDGSGIDVLESFKEKFPEVKVIVNTGYVDQRIIDQSERLGADAFLQKPFNLVRLRDEISRLLA